MVAQPLWQTEQPAPEDATAAETAPGPGRRGAAEEAEKAGEGLQAEQPEGGGDTGGRQRRVACVSAPGVLY